MPTGATSRLLLFRTMIMLLRGIIIKACSREMRGRAFGTRSLQFGVLWCFRFNLKMRGPHSDWLLQRSSDKNASIPHARKQETSFIYKLLLNFDVFRTVMVLQHAF
jgi:hypothetical protein